MISNIKFLFSWWVFICPSNDVYFFVKSVKHRSLYCQRFGALEKKSLCQSLGERRLERSASMKNSKQDGERKLEQWHRARGAQEATKNKIFGTYKHILGDSQKYLG